MLCLAAIAALTLAGPPAGPVVVKPPPHVAAYPGVTVEIPLAIEVAPGFHVQANPASRPELIPLSVRITDGAGLRVAEPLYPRGVDHRIGVSPDPISVYEGSFLVGIPVEVSEAVSPGERILRGQLRFQSCDDKRCHLPASLPFAVAVRIAPPPAPARDSAATPPRRKQPTRRSPSNSLDRPAM